MEHKGDDGYYKCLGKFHFENRFIEQIEFNPFKTPKVRMEDWVEKLDDKNNSVSHFVYVII